MTQTRYYADAAVATTLAGALNNTDTSSVFTVAAMTGYPSVPFTAVLDVGTANEELVSVTNVTGTAVTATRGINGTTKRTHALGGTFKHCASALDFTDANAHINAAASVAHPGAFIMLAGGSAGDAVNVCVGGITGTTESDGTLAVTHGLGDTPDGVLVSLSSAGAYLGAVNTYTSTEFTIMAYDASDNTPLDTASVAGSFFAWASA